MKKPAVFEIVLVLGVSLFGLFIYLNIEPYEEKFYTGEGPEAIDNQFLALQRHLAEYQTKVVILEDVNPLFSKTHQSPVFPQVNDTLLITSADVIMSQTMASDILAWVAQGGQLIMGLSTGLGEGDVNQPTQNSAKVVRLNFLLHNIGVKTALFETDQLINNERNRFYNKPTRVDTESFGNLDIDVQDNTYIELTKSQNIVFSAAPFLEEHANKPTIMQISVGEGMVTLLTDSFIWTNEQINNNNNVLLAHQLISQQTNMYVIEPPILIMWPSVILRYSPSFYWILTLFLILCAWHAAIRFGAIRVVNDTVVSYFSAHISAAGKFYWRHDQQERLVGEVRQVLIEEVHSKLGHHHASETQITEALATVSKWPKEKIHLFVFDQRKLNETQFTQLIQGLKQLRGMIWKH